MQNHDNVMNTYFQQTASVFVRVSPPTTHPHTKHDKNGRVFIQLVHTKMVVIWNLSNIFTFRFHQNIIYPLQKFDNN